MMCAGALKKGAQKSVTKKIAWAPWKRSVKVDGSSRSAWIISMPCEAREAAEELDALRVIPRTFQSGDWRYLAATEPPCLVRWKWKGRGYWNYLGTCDTKHNDRLLHSGDTW